MRQVAIAFTTTGNDPKKDHRFREMVAIEQLDDQSAGRVLHLCFKTTPDGEGKTFAEQFKALDELVGNSVVIVHKGGVWKQFLRAELRLIEDKRARRLLKQVFDVTAWAHERFPRQRKSVEAIARKLNLTVSHEHNGLSLEADRLGLIGAVACQSEVEATESALPSPESNTARPHVAESFQQSPHELIRHPLPKRSFQERLQFCWLVMTGRG
jgi:hypothetical protein